MGGKHSSITQIFNTQLTANPIGSTPGREIIHINF